MRWGYTRVPTLSMSGATERTRSMPRTKDKVTGVAGTAKPYVERALHDEELREHVKQAYSAAREIYDELVPPRGVTNVATRFSDDRGWVMELRRESLLPKPTVQTNVSFSRRGV